jgi:RsiW-degrading membrane proteinase PrsW (M82 family)
MDTSKRLTNVLISLGVILVIFAVIMFVLGTKTIGAFNFSVDQATLVLRFVFVIIGLLIAFAVYWFTRDNAAWEIGTREVVWMAIGAALYAVFSWLFNGTVFVVPSLSQYRCVRRSRSQCSSAMPSARWSASSRERSAICSAMH